MVIKYTIGVAASWIDLIGWEYIHAKFHLNRRILSIYLYNFRVTAKWLMIYVLCVAALLDRSQMDLHVYRVVKNNTKRALQVSNMFTSLS